MKQRGGEEEEKGKQIHCTSRGLCQGKLPRCQMEHNDWLLVGLFFLLVTVTNSLHKNNLSVANSMKPRDQIPQGVTSEGTDSVEANSAQWVS